MTASPGSSILPSGTLGDPFEVGVNMLTQANKVATIASRPATIPRYTHDISHSLACELRESFPRTPSRRYAIHPLGCLVFYLGECFGFSALSSQRKLSKEDGSQHDAGDNQVAHWNFRSGRRLSGGDHCVFRKGLDGCRQG